MTINMIIFVVVKKIYYCHDYSAFGFVAKIISLIFIVIINAKTIKFSITISIMVHVFYNYKMIYNYKIMITKFILSFHSLND